MGGGYEGWGANSEQWSVGERGLRVTVGGRGFYALISLVCHWQLIQSQLPVQRTECIQKKTFIVLFSVLHHNQQEGPERVRWGRFAIASRLNGIDWHLCSTRWAKSQDLSLFPKCFKGGRVIGQGVMGLVGRKDQRGKPSSAVGVTTTTQPPMTACHGGQLIGHSISGWQLKFGILSTCNGDRQPCTCDRRNKLIRKTVDSRFWSIWNPVLVHIRSHCHRSLIINQIVKL